MGTMYFPMYDSAVNRLYIGCASSEACVQGGAFQYFCLLLPVFGGFLAGYSNYNPDLFASRFNRYIGCAENPMF